MNVARLVIAAASPWSKRSDSTAGRTVPTNVTIERLDLHQLRELYAAAEAVVPEAPPPAKRARRFPVVWLLLGFVGLVVLLVGGGLLLFACLMLWDTPWAILPLGIAFPLLGPFAAVGLYEGPLVPVNAEDALHLVFPKRVVVATGAVLVAAWLVEGKQSVIENMAPVLTRLYTPLFTAVLLVFVLAMIWTGTNEIMNLLIQHEYYKELAGDEAGKRNIELDAISVDGEEEKVFE